MARYMIIPRSPSTFNVYSVVGPNPMMSSFDRVFQEGFSSQRDAEQWVDRQLKADKQRHEFQIANPPYIYPRQGN